MVNYEIAVKKPFTDIGKLIIGIIISFIPIVNWIAKGFIIECSGFGKTKKSDKMPKWDNWVDLFIKGFASFAITLIYAIPAILVLLSVAGLAAFSLANTFVGTGISNELMSMATSGASQEAIGNLISENLYLALPTILALAPMIILGLLLLLVAVYLAPVAIVNYLKNKKFGKAFDFGYVFKMAFTSKYFVAWIVSALITFVATVLLSLIPLVGSQIAMFVSGVISFTIYGDALREIKKR